MDKKFIEDFDKKQKSHKHKRHKDSNRVSNVKAKQQKLEETDFVKPSTSYRDRAKERREGINKDFELDPDDLIISNPIISSSGQEGDDDESVLDEKERRLQQIEESKYLGGDVEHTHLVKGLDFALLEKVKNDQKLAEKLMGDNQKKNSDFVFDDNSDSEEEEFRTEAIIAASSTSSSKRQLVDIEKLKKGQSTDMIPCRTAIARRVLNVLDEKWPEKSQLFLPGRMSYIIPIDDDCEDDTVTTIVRSKADTTSSNDSGMESDFALDQLVNILAKIRRGKDESTETSKKIKSWDKEDDIMNDYSY